MSVLLGHRAFVLSVALALVSFASCDVDVITRICRFEGCFDLDESDPNYSGAEYNRKLGNLFTSGIPQLIYGNVSSLTKSLRGSVSTSCTDHLNSVAKGIDDGREWAFQMLDSSGKMSPAFLMGTVTSLGDYDECLAIQARDTDIIGQYCMVDVFPRAYKGNSKAVQSSGQISLATPRHFNASAYYFGLCFPAACSKSDVRVLVKKVLEPFPLLVEGDLHCDTAESISFKSHFMNISFASALSLIFLSTIIGTVLWGTTYHILFGNEATTLQKCFSIINNAHKLFYDDPESSRFDLVANVKLGIVFFGTASHVLFCIESAIGGYVLSHHKNIEAILSSPFLSQISSDFGLAAMTYVSGATLFAVAYPLAIKGKLPLKLALILRVLKHLPGLITIVALDLVWYLWGSGPFWSRVGKYQVDKCSKSWWRNFLFISNLWGSPIEICAGHTYFSSIDVQLFIFGLFAIVLLAKRPFLGVLYCTAFTVVPTGLTYYYAATRNLPPMLMVPRDAYVPKMEEYLVYIHMSMSGYMPSYFLAILVCYTIHLGFWKIISDIVTQIQDGIFKSFLFYKTMLGKSEPIYAGWLPQISFLFTGNVSHVFWLLLFQILEQIRLQAPLIPNYFNALTPEWTPAFIVFTRTAVIFEMSTLLIYTSLIKVGFYSKPIPRNSNRDENSNAPPTEQLKNVSEPLQENYRRTYSVQKALTRLSFAIYLSNYYYIRTDFFMQRILYQTTIFNLLTRLMSSMVYILITAFIFQIIFLGPFTNLKNELFKKQDTQEKKMK